MSPITTLCGPPMWRGQSISKITLAELEEAEAHVARTLATMLESEKRVRELLPHYRANPDIIGRFQELGANIAFERARRDEAVYSCLTA